MMTADEIRAKATTMLTSGEQDLTTIWVEFIARGGVGSIPDLDEFLAGLNPLDEVSVQLLGVTLQEIQNP
ncbi:hypothetical protein ACIPY1_17690 [Paenarthrobacter nicotinovorans]|uniref:hypothetical protein n=1 Tax=Paenarthrobacter nicotinovorans TaxID=29320 RepID=UPI00381C0090